MVNVSDRHPCPSLQERGQVLTGDFWCISFSFSVLLLPAPLLQSCQGKVEGGKVDCRDDEDQL